MFLIRQCHRYNLRRESQIMVILSIYSLLVYIPRCKGKIIHEIQNSTFKSFNPLLIWIFTTFTILYTIHRHHKPRATLINKSQKIVSVLFFVADDSIGRSTESATNNLFLLCNQIHEQSIGRSIRRPNEFSVEDKG